MWNLLPIENNYIRRSYQRGGSVSHRFQKALFLIAFVIAFNRKEREWKRHETTKNRKDVRIPKWLVIRSPNILRYCFLSYLISLAAFISTNRRIIQLLIGIRIFLYRSTRWRTRGSGWSRERYLELVTNERGKYWKLHYIRRLIWSVTKYPHGSRYVCRTVRNPSFDNVHDKNII